MTADRESIELADCMTRSLISADLRLFYGLAIRPDLERLRPIAILALMPFMSAFIYESASYAESTGLVSSKDLKGHEVLLRTSRLRLKLLDDSRKSFAEVLTDAGGLAAINSSWFLNSRYCIIRALKRWFQRDLGIFFIQDQVICTTHIAFLNIGLTQEALTESSLSIRTLGPYLKVTAVDFGRYVGLLSTALDVDKPKAGESLNELTSRIRYRDLKSDRFYASMSDRVAPDNMTLCILVTMILSQVNTARSLAPLVADDNQTALFKVRFLSAFHAISSLQQLLNEDRRKRILDPELADRIRELLGTDSVRRIRKSNNLRNTLMHYRIEEPVTSRLSDPGTLASLVELCVPSESLATISVRIEQILDHMAVELGGLLPDGLIANRTM